MAIKSEHLISAELADWQTPVEDKDLTTSPGGPSNGDKYIIAGTGGDWSPGTINDVVWYINSEWFFITPKEGMQIYIKDENVYYFYNGSVWGTMSGGSGDMLKATYDTTANNIVDKSETVDDGAGNSATAAQVKANVTHTAGDGSDHTDVATNTVKTVKNSDNIILNAFRVAINGSLAVFNMIDGMVDEYEDETGIDTVSSTNEDYDSDNDLYKPTGGVGTITSDTKLMLHMNGSDTSTTFTDASPSEHGNANVSGDAQVDTADKKWGTGSLLLDGTGDYIDFADSADWDFATDHTIEFQVKLNTLPGHQQFLIYHGSSGNPYWMIEHGGAGTGFGFHSESPAISCYQTTPLNDTTSWHHIAMCKVGSDYGLYIDGVQEAYASQASAIAMVGNLYIGMAGWAAAYPVDGHMDEVKIHKANIFNASPVVGKTDTIDVPTRENSTVGVANDMTLISDTFVAESAPDNARMVILEEDVDAITLNTDLKAWASNDDGANWHQGTLSDEGDYDTSKRILVADFDVSAQTDTDMIYKLTTHNGKNLKIHACGLSWD